MHHRGQPITGASTFLALIEDRNLALHVFAQWHMRRHFDQRGHEHLIAKIHRVAARIEATCRWAPRRGSAAAALCAPGGGANGRRGLFQQLPSAAERLLFDCGRRRHRASARWKIRRTQHTERQRVQPLTVGLSVLAAIDALGDLVELTQVGQVVQAIALPVHPSDAKAHIGLGGALGGVDQVDPEQCAVAKVVGPAGDLDRATAPEAGAIAGLGVAHPLSQPARAFAALLRLGGPPAFLQPHQFARFVADLRQKGRCPQIGVDAELGHRLVQRIQVLRQSGRRGAAHDLPQSKLGQHVTPPA